MMMEKVTITSAHDYMGNKRAWVKWVTLLCAVALLSGCVSTGSSSKEPGHKKGQRSDTEEKHKASKRAESKGGVDALVLREGELIPFRVPGVTLAIQPAWQSSPHPSNHSVYLVQPGDTLSKISRLHGTSVASLKEVNNLSHDLIKVGQRLLVPPVGRPARTLPPD